MVGRTLGHYRIQEQIGAGGMGVVYRARDERLEREVALKVLPPGTLADDVARRRFRKEALTLSQLNHPHIATVHDFDTQEGVDFLVMELIPGVTLAEQIKAGPLPEKEVSGLGAQLARGLAAAHEQGVVHRDLKPGNVRVTPQGWVKILDFGLATLSRALSATASTVTPEERGVVAGTLPYLAPEQLRGEKADARSDIYSAGVVLYEMATGRRPHTETRVPELVAAVLEQTPPSPSSLNKKVSPALEMIILKALDKDPERRYQSVRELAVDLERLSAPVTVAVPARRWPRWRWAAAAALVLVLAAVLVYVLVPRGRPLESLAVLPFVNASGSPDAEYLSDGIADTLINSLAQLPSLKVISRTSVFRYKGREIDPQVVGRELRVEAVLTGEVRQRGENLSITAELVNARDRSHIWGQRYNRRTADLLAIQEEIGREISENLRLRLTGEQKKALAKRHTQNPQAYQEYLKGLYFWNKRTGPAAQTAIQHFDRAIALDPSYAQAYAGLAQCYSLISYFSPMPPRESLPKLQAAATKALQLDDTLAEAHIAEALSKEYEPDRAGAERHFRRAIELNPNSADAHLRYAMHLMMRARFDESIAEMKRAQELEPVTVVVNNLLGLAYHNARRHDEALEQYRKTLDMDPSFGSARLYLGELYIVKSMYPEALAELKEAVKLMHQAPLPVSALAFAYARSGHRAAARRILDQMLAERARQGYYPASRIALVYLGLGDKDRAFEWLAKAVEERELVFLKVNPLFDPLRSDPRFTELLRRMNLAPGAGGKP